MKRLRHPIRAIREPFGTAGLIVACIALVAALGGTALAAKSALTGKQKKEVEKIAKKFAGKPGAPGAPGAQGNPGAAGAAGKDGTNGTNGTNGTPGTNGKSVVLGTATTTPVTGECPTVGGTTVEVEGTPASKKHICNGKEGEPGAIHPGETLPSEASETGTWAFSEAATEPAVLWSSISFPVPLAAPIENAPECGTTGNPDCVVHVFEFGEPIPAGCTGTEAAPFVENLGAEPGNLCIYVFFSPNHVTAADVSPVNPEAGTAGAGRAGAILKTGVVPAEATGVGAWAVTAP
jgi:hypothetical protein